MSGGRAAPGDSVHAGVDVRVHRERAMGTVFSFRVLLTPGDPTRADVDRLVAEACRLLHRHDALLSPWRADSALSDLRGGRSHPGTAPGELREVLRRCAEARELSGGWFDPWAMPGGVDPTGLVKGWSAEQAMDVLRCGGVEAALLNAGGDVTALGRPAQHVPWRAGIRHPWRPDSLACVVDVRSALATSGTYERGPHLVDPRTGRPHASAVSASVTGDDLAMVDALATALAVGGRDALAAMPSDQGYEAYLVLPNGSELSTPGFPFVG